MITIILIMHNHLSQPRKMQFPFILIRLNPNEKNTVTNQISLIKSDLL